MTISQRDRISELESEVELLRSQLAAKASEGPLLNALLRDISERRRIEDRLDEAQQWLHLAQEVGRVAAYSYDFATKMLSWSPSAYRLYGIPLETEPSLDLWLGRIHPDDRSTIRSNTLAAIERGTDIDQEFRTVQPDGSIRSIRDRGRILLSDTGAPARIVGLNIDVTDDRRAADALNRGAARFSALAETTNAIVWAVDPSGRFVETCASWAKFTGQQFAGYHDFGWVEAIHPDDRATTLEIWNTASAAEIEYKAQYRLRRADGEYRHMLVRAMPVRDSAGNVIEYAGSNIDITDQIETAKIIVDREERLRAALVGAGAGTFRWDIRTNSLEWDVELDRLFGLPPGETARSLESFLERVHPDDRPAVIAACERCAAQGEDFDQDFRVIWPDGTVRWLYDRGTTARGSDGRPAYMTGSCIDVTDRKAATARLQDSEERLRMAQDAGGVGTFEWYPADNRIVGSPRYCELWGHPADFELDVDGLIAQIHPEDQSLAGKYRSSDISNALNYAEFRIRRADTGELRWLARQGQLVNRDTGEARFVGVLYDITDAKTSAQHLEAVLESITDAFIAVNADWSVKIFNRAAESHLMIARDEALDRPLSGALRKVLSPALEEMLAQSMRSREPRAEQLDGAGDQGRAFEWKSAPTPDGGLAITFADVTDRREAERLRELLVGELQHRLKNLFSIVQATAHQTFKAADVPQPVRTTFNARISALSRAHDLVLEEHWDSTTMSDVLERALAPFVSSSKGRVRWGGPMLVLPARSAIAVTLAVHELATNAVKYGALSNDNGTVEIRWSHSQTSPGSLSFEWQEHGGPVVRPPEKKGFGSTLIERSLASELGGEVELSYAPEGFRCMVRGAALS